VTPHARAVGQAAAALRVAQLVQHPQPRLRPLAILLRAGCAQTRLPSCAPRDEVCQTLRAGTHVRHSVISVSVVVPYCSRLREQERSALSRTSWEAHGESTITVSCGCNGPSAAQAHDADPEELPQSALARPLRCAGPRSRLSRTSQMVRPHHRVRPIQKRLQVWHTR